MATFSGYSESFFTQLRTTVIYATTMGSTGSRVGTIYASTVNTNVLTVNTVAVLGTSITLNGANNVTISASDGSITAASSPLLLKQNVSLNNNNLLSVNSATVTSLVATTVTAGSVVAGTGTLSTLAVDTITVNATAAVDFNNDVDMNSNNITSVGTLGATLVSASNINTTGQVTATDVETNGLVVLTSTALTGTFSLTGDAGISGEIVLGTDTHIGTGTAGTGATTDDIGSLYLKTNGADNNEVVLVADSGGAGYVRAKNADNQMTIYHAGSVGLVPPGTYGPVGGTWNQLASLSAPITATAAGLITWNATNTRLVMAEWSGSFTVLSGTGSVTFALYKNGAIMARTFQIFNVAAANLSFGFCIRAIDSAVATDNYQLYWLASGVTSVQANNFIGTLREVV